jgi:peptide/nickel transport system permease protein
MAESAVETTKAAVEGAVPAIATVRRRRVRIREIHVLLAVLAFVLVVALFPQVFRRHNPYSLLTTSFTPPNGQYWFGTDEIGRDLYARVVQGLQISLFSAALAVVIALVAGSVIGILSGVRPSSPVDRALTMLTESVMAIPSILLALAVITTYGRGAYIAAIAIGIGESMGFARLVRGLVIRSGTLTYVEAARTCGARPLRIVRRHIVPSIFHPVLSYTALQFGLALLAIGALSYLGFGESPPSPEWGVLIADGQQYLATAWWVAIIPGIMLTVLVVLLNRIAYLLHQDNT